MNEIVAYWNGNQLRALFEAIVFIVGGDDFLGLLRTVAVFGLLIMTTMGVLRQRAMEPMAYIAALALFYSLMLLPKMDLTIKDVRSGNVYVVNNVPYGVGVFASAASHIGTWLTDTFEAAFAPTDAEKFSRFGVVYPQRLLSTLQSLGPVTPEGREMLGALVKDCVVPEMLDSSVKASQIINSTNIWGTVTTPLWLNAARFTVNSAGAPVSCDALAASIDVYFANVEVPAMQQYLGIKVLPDHINPSAAIASSLPQAEAALMGMARSLRQSLTQSAMLDMVPTGVAMSGAQGQPLQVAINLAARQANLAADINYKSMADVARDSLPKLRNTVEFVIIAAFPLMLIMVIAAGHYAGTMLRTYFVMLLWVQLWAPLYAVLNYLVISTDTNPMTQLIAAYGGNTLQSAGLIQAMGSSSAAIAGGLTVLVPIIAYYLASRAEIAASSMVGSIMQPAQSAGGAMATQAAQGNVSMGNVSWGNASTNNWGSNKNDRSITFGDPSSLTQSGAYGQSKYAGDGNGPVLTSNAPSMGAFSAASQTAASASSGSSSALTASSQVAKEALHESGRSAVFGALQNADFSRQLSQAVGFDAGFSRVGNAGQSGSQSLTADTKLSVSEGGSRESAAILQSGVRGAGSFSSNVGVTQGAAASGQGGPSRGQASASVGGGANVSTGLNFADRVANSLQTGRSEGATGQVGSRYSTDDLRRASLAVEAKSDDQSVKRAGEQFRAGLDRIDAARAIERATVSSGMESRQTADVGTRNAVLASRDDAAQIQQYARDRGMTDADLLRAGAAPASAEGRQFQALLQQYQTEKAGADGSGSREVLGKALGAPITRSEVQQWGNGQVAHLAAVAEGRVTSASARNSAAVEAVSPVSARSGPDNWDPTVQAAAQQVQEASDNTANRVQDARYLGASSALGDYLNREQTSGSGAPFKLLAQNSPFANDFGFRSPQEATQALDRVWASGTATDRDQILRLGQDLERGQATPERVRDTLQYVEMRDGQLKQASRPPEETSREYAVER